MRTDFQFKNYTIAQIQEKLINEEFSALDLVNYCINKIEQTHSELNAIVIRNFDQARIMAAQADERIQAKLPLRPLEGIPYISKPLFCIKGLQTNACSRIIENFIPPYESTVTQRLQDAGAIVLGASNMDEFAMGGSTTHTIYGPTYNYHTRKDGKKVIAGGSSGGSAVAVAAGLAPFALGSDTGGSVRQPAALNGCVGIKPSFGRCSRFGMIAFASSLDQAGIFTNNTEDAAHILQIIAGNDPQDSTCANQEVPNFSQYINHSLKGLKIGIPIEVNKFDINPDIRKLWEHTKQELQKAGCEIKEIHLENIPYSISTYYTIAPIEAASNLARYDGIRYGSCNNYNYIKNIGDLYVQNRSQGFGDEVKRRILLGSFLTSGENLNHYYNHAKKMRNLIHLDFIKAFEEVDAILMPTTPDVANAIDEEQTVLQEYMADIMTVSVSLAGMPGISVPVGKSSSGLPIGMQIIANKFNEQVLFQMSKALCNMHQMQC